MYIYTQCSRQNFEIGGKIILNLKIIKKIHNRLIMKCNTLKQLYYILLLCTRICITVW